MPGRRSRGISLPSWRSLSASPATLRTSKARFGRWKETRQTFASFIPSWTRTSSPISGVAVAVRPRMGGRPSDLGGAAQAEVRGAEVVSPLGDAVRLVDAEERELHPRQRLLHRRRVDRLGRDHHQLDRALADGGRIGGALLGRAGRIDAHHRDAGRLELAVLILDERQQRRDDQCRPLQHQRGQLIGQRLAAAGRHDRQRVATRQHRLDDLRLPGSKLPDVEDRAHLLERAQQPRRRGAGAAASIGAAATIDGATSRPDADRGCHLGQLVRGVGGADHDGRNTVIQLGRLQKILYRARASAALVAPAASRTSSSELSLNSCEKRALTLAVQPNCPHAPCGKPLRGPSQTTAALQRRCGRKCREPRALQTS